MRHATCEVCQRSVLLTVDILASAALDLMATMFCPCGAELEACYVDNVLLTATVPRMLRFEDLQAERNKAMAVLLQPELI